MAKVVITHNVADVDAWLSHSAERAEAIGGLGGTNVVDHVAEDGSSSVAVAAETDDVAALLSAIASPSPELAAVMEKHGVQPPLVTYVQR